jgi:Flp pilus assembly protein TadG
MTTVCSTRSRLANSARNRTGIAAIFAALLMVFLLGLAAFAVDIGYIYMSYSQLQSSSDSGSLAGAQLLVNDSLVKASPTYTTAHSNARSAAVSFAASNRVGAALPSVDSNSSNSSDGDVVLGYMADPSVPGATLDFSNPLLFNAVQVRVRKHSNKNGLVESFFSKVWGNPGEPLAARATAVMSSSIVGFKVTSESGNADVLPFAVKKSAWDALLAGSGADDFKYDSTGAVVSGSDGILELNMFPVDNGASGNSGTVDIGNSNNSTADLTRQIRYGVNSSDLAYIGGALQLGADGTLVLNGDTGISAGIKDDLESIKGKPRSICLYSTVAGNGNNAMYTIVGFAGVRIMKVKLTGNPKYVTIQPAAVVDAAAIIGNTTNASRYVYSNVRLVR